VSVTFGDDPTQRFSARAGAYARARPGYPDAAVAALVHALALTDGATIVDLGCGTGLSSEAFLRAGCRVIGVEPNEAMRQHAARLREQQPRFTLVNGRAEATSLDAACADLVIAAQAFHWFDVKATRAEALRILRQPPLAALLWNDRRTQGSEFARGYEELLVRYGTDYLEVQRRHERADRIEQFFGNNQWQTISVTHDTPLDFDSLADRLNSASYAPASSDSRYRPMMQSLRELFLATERDGMVAMEFETRIHFGQIRPDGTGQPWQAPATAQPS